MPALHKRILALLTAKRQPSRLLTALEIADGGNEKILMGLLQIAASTKIIRHKRVKQTHRFQAQSSNQK
jgi:predicted Zn-ribbon and HTH transcriptional regulator